MPSRLNRSHSSIDVGDRAALVVRVVGEVAVQRLVGLVEELLVARHRRIAGVLGHPRLELAEDREVLLVHLRVGRVAERPDEHAAERVEVEPREDLGMRGRELDDAARLGLARRERAGADLLVAGRPRPREVAVEIDRVVAEEERRRDRACRRSARSCPRDTACRTGPRPRACARRAGRGTRAPRRARRPDP